ncbi:MAG: hypothetical protein IJ783_11360 [Kiritimatiellae bacterium]|nr:hypothetical protein [Kiritimatiellia bacterium]
MKNPAAALDAILEPSEAQVGRFTLHAPTLGMLALLQKIGSPFACPDVPTTLETLAETLFALAHVPGESRTLLSQGPDVFTETAATWADGVSNAEASALLREAGRMFGLVDRANPAPDSATQEGGAGADPSAPGPTAG